MTRALLDAFVEALGVAGAKVIASDESSVQAELKLEVAKFPSDEVIARAYSAIGYESKKGTSDKWTERWSGRAKDAKHTLRCTLMTGRTSRIALDWKSGTRPSVGAEYEWQGRKWPVFFEEANLYAESRELLIIEGKLSATVIAKYRAWATKAGFSPYREYEPDLSTSLDLSDAYFLVKVEDRAPFVTLSVLPNPDAPETADVN